MLVQGPRWAGGYAADCCVVVRLLPLRKPQRNAQLTSTLRMGQNPQTKSKTNAAKARRIRETSAQGPADHSRDATLQDTISSRFGLKITKLASRRSEHRNVVEMRRHFPQGRFGPMSEWPSSTRRPWRDRTIARNTPECPPALRNSLMPTEPAGGGLVLSAGEVGSQTVLDIADPRALH
jgi:hypothetical protein